MPNTATVERKVSAHQAVRQVVQRTKRPLSAKEIIDRVLATPGVELHGLTPRATISATLSNAAKAGEIMRVERGLYRKAA